MRVGPMQHGANHESLSETRDLTLASSPLAEAELPGRALREAVVLPGVRRCLHLRRELSIGVGQVEVVQPARGARRIRVIQRASLVGVVESPRWSFDLA